MNVVEMKLDIIETVAQTHDEGTITRFYEAIHDVMDEDDDSDGWSDLSLEEQMKLDAAIAETYDTANLVSKEDAYKMMDKWLTK